MMAEFRKRGSGTVLFLVFLAACGATDIPIEPEQRHSESQATLFEVSTGVDLPDWIVVPEVLPSGRIGKNNCTFPFGEPVQWDVHSDAGCWEHPGPDGWTRQQSQRIHIPVFAACGNGPGDATAIRVCRAGGRGQPSPCSLNPTTGPNGCARCVVNPTCH